MTGPANVEIHLNTGRLVPTRRQDLAEIFERQCRVPKILRVRIVGNYVESPVLLVRTGVTGKVQDHRVGSSQAAGGNAIDCLANVRGIGLALREQLNV
jgi:hypothetical protein